MTSRFKEFSNSIYVKYRIGWILFATIGTFRVKSALQAPAQSDDSKPDECRKYNQLFNQLKGFSNKEACNNNRGCLYHGFPVVGSCESKGDRTLPKTAENRHDKTTKSNHRDISHEEFSRSVRDKDLLDSNQVERVVDSVKRKIYAEIVGEDNVSKDMRPIKILVDVTLVPPILDSLKDSHGLASALSKEIIENILHSPESPPKLGEWLQYIFAYESVRSPTRWLIYWSLSRRDTISLSTSLLKIQMRYWCVQDGAPTTRSLLLNLTQGWLKYPATQKDLIVPLIEWTVRDEYIHKSLATLIVVSTPSAKVSCSMLENNEINAIIDNLTVGIDD